MSLSFVDLLGIPNDAQGKLSIVPTWNECIQKECKRDPKESIFCLCTGIIPKRIEMSYDRSSRKDKVRIVFFFERNDPEVKFEFTTYIEIDEALRALRYM